MFFLKKHDILKQFRRNVIPFDKKLKLENSCLAHFQIIKMKVSLRNDPKTGSVAVQFSEIHRG